MAWLIEIDALKIQIASVLHIKSTLILRQMPPGTQDSLASVSSVEFKCHTQKIPSVRIGVREKFISVALVTHPSCNIKYCQSYLVR